MIHVWQLTATRASMRAHVIMLSIFASNSSLNFNSSEFMFKITHQQHCQWLPNKTLKENYFMKSEMCEKLRTNKHLLINNFHTEISGCIIFCTCWPLQIQYKSRVLCSILFKLVNSIFNIVYNYFQRLRNALTMPLGISPK